MKAKICVVINFLAAGYSLWGIIDAIPQDNVIRTLTWLFAFFINILPGTLWLTILKEE